MTVTVREATATELAPVLGVLDGAALETDADAVRASIERDETLVAVADGSDRDATVVGALVLAGEEITAVAVRPGRRGQGVGSALVAAAADRQGRLVAVFDGRVRSFYDRLGFAVEPAGEDRYRAVYEREEA